MAQSAQSEPTSTKPVHTIILDSGPLLKNEPSISTLLAKSDQILTIPEVVAEIRDLVARSRLETTVLPFITVRSPSPKSVTVIAEFAKKTGDFGVLSGPDIKVLALAYELECERNHGDWRLRSVPGQKRVNGAPPESLKQKKADEQGVISPEKPEQATTVVTDEDDPSRTTSTATVPPASGAQEALIPKTSSLPTDELQAEVDGKEPVSTATQITTETSEADSVSADESDSEGWITPSNIKKQQAKDSQFRGLNESSTTQTLQVATLTTDFAMQNVLLQMNLNILSTHLQRVRHLKTWILRCHACFKTTKDMSRQFCPSCGGNTLMRASCSTDDSGAFKIHLKKDMQWNNRGNVFSVPKPTHGTSNGKIEAGRGGKDAWGTKLVLREDQKEYTRALDEEKRRKARDLMDQDYLPSILTGERSAGGKIKVGVGRTVNSRKKR
jgi:RNA-binding protein NOB1